MATRGDRAVVYLGEPIHSGYVLVRRDHLTNVTSLEHERGSGRTLRSAGRWVSPLPRPLSNGYRSKRQYRQKGYGAVDSLGERHSRNNNPYERHEN